MAHLNEFLTNVDLAELKKIIKESGFVKKYRRGDTICNQGEPCRVIGIVLRGYFKFSVVNTKGEICVTGFSFEDEIVTDFPNSFMMDGASFTTITAGRECEIIQMSTGDARLHMERHCPGFIGHAASVLLIEAYRRYLDLHSKTPRERYVDLITRCHCDISLIPLQEIASYLSISRRQLYRIREEFI